MSADTPGDARTPDKTIGVIKYAEEESQGVTRDERGQEQPKDKKRAQQSAKEGPAAYAPHDEGEAANPGHDPSKKKTGEFWWAPQKKDQEARSHKTRRARTDQKSSERTTTANDKQEIGEATNGSLPRRPMATRKVASEARAGCKPWREDSSST